MRRALLLFVVLALAADPASGALDSIVARVDREVLTWSEVLQERKVLVATGNPDGGLSLEAIREEMVRRTLMALEAERQLLRIDPAAVEEQVENWADRGGGTSGARFSASGSTGAGWRLVRGESSWRTSSAPRCGS